MADIDQDPRVAELLTTAGEEATRFIHPEGVQAVRTTVRRRRRNRAIGVGVATALVLIGSSVAAVAITGSHPPNKTPVVTATSSPPTPSPSVSSLPSSSPSSSPPPAAPDGKIGAGTLRNATLTIPAWPANDFDDSCPRGKVHFSKGKNVGESAGILVLEGSPVYVDVDSDGALETVQLVSCSPQTQEYQVLVFDRDAAGKIVTLGQVVRSEGLSGTEGDDIMKIWGVAAGDNGQVRADVGDYRPCCEEAQASQHQWRTYGWDGTGFKQTGGPAKFGPNPLVTDLKATSKGLTMTKQPNGTWRGTLTVTVRNNGAFVTPGQVEVLAGVNDSWRMTASGCTLLYGSQPGPCRLPAMAKHSSRTVTFTLTAPAGNLDTQCVLYVQSVTSHGHWYPPGNGETRVEVPVTKA